VRRGSDWLISIIFMMAGVLEASRISRQEVEEQLKIAQRTQAKHAFNAHQREVLSLSATKYRWISHFSLYEYQYV